MQKIVRKSYRLDRDLNEAFQRFPYSKSEAVRRAINAAWRDPEVIVVALRERLNTEMRDDDLVETSIVQKEDMRTELSQLSSQSRLPMEQIIRLCMEAYIIKADNISDGGQKNEHHGSVSEDRIE